MVRYADTYNNFLFELSVLVSPTSILVGDPLSTAVRQVVCLWGVKISHVHLFS